MYKSNKWRNIFFKKTGLFQFTNSLELSIKNWPIFLERGINFRANSRTGCKKLAYFLNGVSILEEIFFRRGPGVPIWSPWRRIPTQKIPKSPPPGYRVSLRNRRFRRSDSREQAKYGLSSFSLLTFLKLAPHQPRSIWTPGTGYRVARNFCGSLFLRIGDFWCFAGTNFCD